MNSDLKAMSTFHMSLCIGALAIILLLHFFMNPIQLEGFSEKINAIGMMALVVASFSLLFSNFLFRKRIAQIGTEITNKNIQEIRGAYILKWAFLEGAILINVMIYFLIEHHPVIIVVALLLLLLLYTSKPKLN